MAIGLSAADERMIAKIEADAASSKTSKGKATALIKEIKEAAAKRKKPKFNSKGETVAKEEVKKKPEAKKKPAAKKKPEAKKKPAAKKKVVKKPAVNPNGEAKITKRASARGKLVRALSGNKVSKSSKAVGPTDPNANKSKATQKVGRQEKVVKGTNRTVKPKAIPDGTKIGPAGERISPQSKKTPSKLLSRLAKFGKGAARFAGPAGVAITAGSLLASLIPENTKGGGIGGRKGQAGYKGVDPKKAAKKPVAAAVAKKPVAATAAKKTTTTSSFGAAFKKARKAGLSTFTWPADGGKSYSTATKDDVKKSGSKNLREHLNKQNKKSK